MHIDAARQLVLQTLMPRWPHARVAIIGGSIARGEATASSDIDLLVLFDHVEYAWRETLRIATPQAARTVELFVHDPATFDWFCRESDRPNGRMPLACMVLDGVNVLPDSAAAAWLRDHARTLLAQGPAPLSAAALASGRYEITTLLEDLVDCTATDETLAIAAKLYDALAHFALRAGGAWTGTGKHLARRLRARAPELAATLAAALAAIGTDPARGKVLFEAAAAAALAPHGGALLAGHRLDAPPGWRSAGIAFPPPAPHTELHMDES
ncbi:nucleotidyltransferase-like protein [Pseudoduganella flava]|uniref:Nucleotidyltransferase domain-containing protein n=1 Tax=Pseudoduganella flava TaxID=871742 RepID=A0A562PW50_9BURK|nr:nucleotidyltransferase domain-containing protein [Pseudoduganella flava]QGZ39693.1 nucleotidyltransferase domain-containing protein [Pseudoduganella flava]TWI48603.1 nucleotidyltransferase-like protein [Pseudoduganella flava]